MDERTEGEAAFNYQPILKRVLWRADLLRGRTIQRLAGARLYRRLIVGRFCETPVFRVRRLTQPPYNSPKVKVPSNP
jgi:hypothetical protein